MNEELRITRKEIIPQPVPMDRELILRPAAAAYAEGKYYWCGGIELEAQDINKALEEASFFDPALCLGIYAEVVKVGERDYFLNIIDHKIGLWGEMDLATAATAEKLLKQPSIPEVFIKAFVGEQNV